MGLDVFLGGLAVCLAALDRRAGFGWFFCLARSVARSFARLRWVLPVSRMCGWAWMGMGRERGEGRMGKWNRSGGFVGYVDVSGAGWMRYWIMCGWERPAGVE